MISSLEDSESQRAIEVNWPTSKNEFGDLDYSQYRRRHASLHFYSSIHMVKLNTIIRLLQSKWWQNLRQNIEIAKEKGLSKPINWSSANFWPTSYPPVGYFLFRFRARPFELPTSNFWPTSDVVRGRISQTLSTSHTKRRATYHKVANPYGLSVRTT